MKTDLQYFVEIQNDDQDQDSVGVDLDEQTELLSPSTPVTTASSTPVTTASSTPVTTATTATSDTSSTVTPSNSGSQQKQGKCAIAMS